MAAGQSGRPRPVNSVPVVIRARWVCPVTAPPIEDGVVVVEDDRIVDVAPRRGAPDLTFPNAVLIPGFVNVHSHLELTILRGFLEGRTFPDWIRTLTRTKYDRMDDADLAVSARLGVIENLAAGVTTIGDVTDAGAGWQAMREFGLSGVVYQEVFGPDPSQAAAALDAVTRKIESYRIGETPALRVGVSPHAPYTVSEELFRGVSALSGKKGWPVAIHVAESAEETAFVRDGTGPFAENHRVRGIRVTPRGTGPLEHLDALGVLDSSTLVIHAIHAAPAMIATLAERGVALAHCPKSNMKFGHGIAPITEFISSGIRVGLGTDSVASNNSVDMFEEMRAAVFGQRTRSGDPGTLDAPTALGMATIGGARCLGLEDHVGSLEAGKKAHMVVVNLDAAALTPTYDPVDALVFSASRGDIEAVFLDGRRVEIDSRGIREAARQLAARLR